ncbi:hypothetical protein YC2023_046929 [Brassica napus]
MVIGPTSTHPGERKRTQTRRTIENLEHPLEPNGFLDQKQQATAEPEKPHRPSHLRTERTEHTPTPNPSPRRRTYRRGADWRSGSKARKPRLEGEPSGLRYAPPRAVRAGGNEIYFFLPARDKVGERGERESKILRSSKWPEGLRTRVWRGQKEGFNQLSYIIYSSMNQ